jgi:UDP-galactose transporter B1
LICEDLDLKVLGKSVKPVPVMLLGVLVARKRYPLMKYFYVLLIVVGVVLFMYKKPNETTKLAETGGFVGIGEFLLVSRLEKISGEVFGI